MDVQGRDEAFARAKRVHDSIAQSSHVVSNRIIEILRERERERATGLSSSKSIPGLSSRRADHPSEPITQANRSPKRTDHPSEPITQANRSPKRTDHHFKIPLN
uniref:Uncharacterized protein n=1 Tax=Coccidioides posadasii RMSCC 3488 TaxID=454284 RepID=A0A0J6FHV7_COCPO|nr:hypothetical protein CPAG_05283 [Coccidioides posadasii RMSCC 3488]